MFEFDESQKDLKKDIIEVIWLVVWVSIIIFAGFFALTRGRAIEEGSNLLKFIFTIMSVAFAVYALGIKIAQSMGHLKNFYVPIFDPEKGILPIKNGLLFLLVTLLIITTIAFVLSFKPQSTIAKFIFPLEVGGVPQQVTKSGQVLFGFLNSPSENAFLYFVLSILVTLEFFIMAGLTGLSRKTIFLIFLIPNIIIGSFAWLEIHDLVSQDNSLKQLSHITFGGAMTTTTLLTGTIIIPEVMHAENNLFIKINSVYGHTMLVIVFLISFIILLISIIALITMKKKK